MIIIRYAEYDTQVENWDNQLREMVVAYQLEASPQFAQPELQEGGKTVSGAPAISAYLKAFKKDVDDWRAPGCGV